MSFQLFDLELPDPTPDQQIDDLKTVFCMMMGNLRDFATEQGITFNEEALKPLAHEIDRIEQAYRNNEGTRNE